MVVIRRRVPWPVMCNGSDKRPRPSPRSSLRNLTSGDMPLPERLRLFATNSWLKVRNRTRCCGHYGEPGC